MRYPSYPLIAHDPYFSIWSPSDNLNDSWTKHWTGANHEICGIVRIDGKPRNVNTGDFENWGLELSGDYRFTPHWSLNANYSYLRMDTPIDGAPEGKLYVGANYHRGLWTVSAGLQNVSGLYIATGENAKKENFTLLNAAVSYRVLPFATLFVRGDNILAERYETYAGFPMPKATFMGGVKVSL
jgi:outer membrane receptor protein involved in Fe transport